MSRENEERLDCDQDAMQAYYIMFLGIVEELSVAYEKATSLKSLLDDGYEGDAKSEIDIFVTSLPIHLGRLILFYSKLSEFVAVTALAFLESDQKMRENMEKSS